MARRVAVVDTGTNSTRLLVADIEGGNLLEVARETQITRLGQGVERNGRLDPQAKERVERCFAGYRKLTAYLEAEDTLLLATSSVRDAADGEEFIAALARKAAYDYRILSGAREAELSFTGASIGQPPDAVLLVADIGGGSTELARGKGGEAGDAFSLEIGCVRLTESLLTSDPPLPEELKAAARLVEEKLDSLAHGFLAGFDGLIGVAGSVTALAALDLGLERYDRELVHGHLLTGKAVRRLLGELAAATAAERRSYPVLEAGRADVIVAGALILDRLLERSGAGEIQVSENDILDGAALRYSQHRL